MNNPYVLLKIKETANESEIRKALRNQIDLYCGRDESRKNSDGEYLREIFYNAASQLLNPETRKQIDDSLAKDREKYGLKKYSEDEGKESLFGSEMQQISQVETQEVIFKSNVDRQNYVIRFINKELLLRIKNFEKYELFDEIDDSKIDLANITYAIFGSDSSFMFAQQCLEEQKELKKWYSLHEIFSDGNCVDNKIWCLTDFPYERFPNVNFDVDNKKYCSTGFPWDYGKIFQINGVDSVAITAKKFIPINLICDGKITVANLKKVQMAIQSYLVEHPEFITGIFSSKSINHLEKK